ncbi:hypothetical protein Tco_0864427, partial [Tanacetum coccineum]
MNERCSAVLLNELPSKEKTLGILLSLVKYWRNIRKQKTWPQITYLGPTGGHHSANVTANKVYESGFYWSSVFKDVNDESRLMQLNELAELRDGSYENTRIYKERTKKWHDSRLRGDKDLRISLDLEGFSSIHMAKIEKYYA